MRSRLESEGHAAGDGQHLTGDVAPLWEGEDDVRRRQLRRLAPAIWLSASASGWACCEMESRFVAGCDVTPSSYPSGALAIVGAGVLV